MTCSCYCCCCCGCRRCGRRRLCFASSSSSWCSSSLLLVLLVVLVIVVVVVLILFCCSSSCSSASRSCSSSCFRSFCFVLSLLESSWTHLFVPKSLSLHLRWRLGSSWMSWWWASIGGSPSNPKPVPKAWRASPSPSAPHASCGCSASSEPCREKGPWAKNPETPEVFCIFLLSPIVLFGDFRIQRMKFLKYVRFLGWKATIGMFFVGLGYAPGCLGFQVLLSLGAGAHWQAAPCWFKCWCCKFWTRVLVPSWARLANPMTDAVVYVAPSCLELRPLKGIVAAMVGHIAVVFPKKSFPTSEVWQFCILGPGWHVSKNLEPACDGHHRDPLSALPSGNGI